MPKNKDSIAIPIPLAEAIADEANKKKRYLYQIVEDAWRCYREANGIPAPPDPHAEILAVVRKALDGDPDDARTMRESVLGAAAYILSRGKKR